MNLLRLFIAFFFFFSIPAIAQELGPEALVKKITAEVMDAIKSDKQLAAGDKQKALKLAEEKILPHVDFDEATRLAVGRAWKEATPEQKKKLVQEFRNMLVRTYSNAISAYEGQQMKVMPVRMKPADTEATVHNQFVRPGAPKPVLVDYSMRKTEQGWKIYDIVVEGVSLVLTYRSEFDAIAKQDGIDGLIKRLAQKNTPAGVGSSKK
ncbi:MAG TPA: ABC transporter substrate-binding protein [Burkholderiales bacterium]|nr:ABC transporter substrate-binding protein [Burkholderiales bacterium]